MALEPLPASTSHEETQLNGREPSADEVNRARAMSALLALMAQTATTDDEAARLSHELAELRAHPLRDAAGALEAIRKAAMRSPSFGIARSYRRVAVGRGGEATDDLIAALEAEARFAPTPAAKAALEAHRGLVLERLRDNAAAAKRAYEAALAVSPSEADALLGLLRLAMAELDLEGAAAHAQALAGGLTEAAPRGELFALAARLTERAGHADEALGILAQAALYAPELPSILFHRERSARSPESVSALCTALEAAIEAGTVPAGEAWLEIGFYARLVLDDLALAERALRKAAGASGIVERRCAETELVLLWAGQGRASEAAAIATRLADAETEPLARAIAWTQVGTLREANGEVRGAADAYRRAVETLPSHLPALEGAGRTHAQLDDREGLTWVHLAEAEQGATPIDRAIALRRAADLFAREPGTQPRAIELLQRAWREVPGHDGIFLALERLLAKAKRWDDLRKLYEEALPHVIAPAARARLLMRLGALCEEQSPDLARSVSAYKEAAELPASARELALGELERVLEEVGDLAALEALLLEAGRSAQDPVQQAGFEERLAALREARGDAAGAREIYRSAVAKAPSTHTVVAAAGRAFARAGDHQALIELYEHTARGGSERERVSYGYKAGMLYARSLGDPDAAIARLERVLEESPGHAPSLVALSDLYQGRRSWGELEAVLSKLPDSPPQRVKRAVVAELAGRLEDALTLWEPLAEAGVGLALRAVARLLARVERWPELAARYEADAAASPDDPHARWRAAEIYAERLGDEERAAKLLERAPPASTLALLLARRTPSTSAAATLLARAAEALGDAALRGAVLAELATADLLAGDTPAATRWLASAPGNAVTAVYREHLDEARCDRTALIERLRAQSQETGDADAAAQADVRLARLLDELGSRREALDALERAATALHPPLTAFLMMPRLYAALDDHERYAASLGALAEALPEGELRSTALRRLAGVYVQNGDRERAVGTLEWALRGDPRDFASLRELQRLVDADDHERLVAPLLRAWEQEPPGRQRLALGLAAAVRLAWLGRHDGARDALERVQAESPDHLPALLARAELEARAGEWPAAVQALGRIAEHGDEVLRREALFRLLKAQLGPALDVEGARRSAQSLCALTGSDAPSLALAYRAADAAGAHDEAIEILERLTAQKDVSDDDCARYELELATRYEQHRGDAVKAIEILGRMRVQERRREAIERLMALGEKSNRWDVAAVALEQALERPGGLDPSWEVAIRSRLASLLEGPLGRKEAAVRQYERVVELDASQIPVLERLAHLTADDPKKAMVHHRALIAADPTRLASYRTLRKLALAVSDDDAAFLVEAVLDGAGEADEEEAYFYQQHRARMRGLADGKLERAELEAVAPQLRRPALALFAAVAPALAKVFPVDVAAYGLVAGAASVTPEATLRECADRVAAMLGVGSFALHLVANRLGPCVELGSPTPLFLPRALDEAPPREQAFTLGELLGRVAFGLQVGDPRRVAAVTPTLVDYLGWAIREIGDGTFVSPARGKAVYDDIRRHLGAALDSEETKSLVPLVRDARAAD